MFRKILVANRGEIALRIIRSAKEMGIKTVAIYSEADKESLHVQFADEAFCVGPPTQSKSYLNIPNIISSAIVSGTDAIHPGYGFLAENAEFAEVCSANGFKFIGPTKDVMALLGDKAKAKKLMKEAGVPVIPGSPSTLCNLKEAMNFAKEVGYPVIVKAAQGGGGRGMRVAKTEADLKKAYDLARTEAEATFDSAEVYLEKYVENPRHIEMQILVDEHGNGIYLGERECSLQRRHQKVLEESPSVAVDDSLRKKMGEAAIKGALAAGYTNAGTIEFLLDRQGNFYFMEMNTRIQVEHPVTEMVTGLDLIKEQIKVAAGQPLSLQQEDVEIRGHAIECRINAEDLSKDFRPTPGPIQGFLLPGGTGIRVDTAVYAGYDIPPYYDSLFAKLIVWGNDREEAICRMRRALDEFIVEGISTTIPFHKKVLENEHFIKGDIDTAFIAKHILKDH
ncbi:MAG: acetyl-CoA carboxylase biotin carboxylase subunit [Firmicutes bacterium]|nr:acetyl-CoA carboxylase biotin carboxylase subunit [Bacillota bacterium]MDD4263601.1 acetyl-CoA carboxylase biotin carboxylase subunit [Bacillota bacterium]MDD4693904.1 acetyl-CoA carboxylase biotin carboxylase subunit [Bacillota bacterium]